MCSSSLINEPIGEAASKCKVAPVGLVSVCVMVSTAVCRALLSQHFTHIPWNVAVLLHLIRSEEINQCYIDSM